MISEPENTNSKVDDAVYWRRNAGKKVESMWIGPVVIINAKFDEVFADKSRRDVKVMNHDEQKQCEARKLPQRLVDYGGIIFFIRGGQFLWEANIFLGREDVFSLVSVIGII